LGEAYFHGIKGREALSRSYKDVITTDNYAGLTESFFTSTECIICTQEFKMFILEFSLHLKTLLLFFD
jgi:hypothetical protein